MADIMNRDDFKAMAIEFFIGPTQQRPSQWADTHTVRTSLVMLAMFAQQVYKLGEANGEYEIRKRYETDRRNALRGDHG